MFPAAVCHYKGRRSEWIFCTLRLGTCLALVCVAARLPWARKAARVGGGAVSDSGGYQSSAALSQARMLKSGLMYWGCEGGQPVDW